MKTIVLVLALLLASCTNETRSRAALLDAGFTDIELTGWDVFACSEDDTFSTGFTAKNPQGRAVSGTVCCGAMKGCTIRW